MEIKKMTKIGLLAKLECGQIQLCKLKDFFTNVLSNLCNNLLNGVSWIFYGVYLFDGNV